jgi:hypothetical protein
MLYPRAAIRLQRSIDELRERIAEIGRSAGPSWARDHKDAAPAAWLALCEPVSR